jgi:hypothetical protein
MMTDEHEEILQAIERLDRRPLQELLARELSVKPSVAALQVFCDKYPDRHAQAIAILTRQVGYSEAPHVTISIEGKIRSLSDAELGRAYTDLMKQLETLRCSIQPPASQITDVTPQHMLVSG